MTPSWMPPVAATSLATAQWASPAAEAVPVGKPSMAPNGCLIVIQSAPPAVAVELFSPCARMHRHLTGCHPLTALQPGPTRTTTQDRVPPTEDATFPSPTAVAVTRSSSRRRTPPRNLGPMVATSLAKVQFAPPAAEADPVGTPSSVPMHAVVMVVVAASCLAKVQPAPPAAEVVPGASFDRHQHDGANNRIE